MGDEPLHDLDNSFVIITEYNRSIQGFLVSHINCIINLSWTDILPPPNGIGHNNFLSAITKVDAQLIEIIDVEKVLAEAIAIGDEVAEELVDSFTTQNKQHCSIF